VIQISQPPSTQRRYDTTRCKKTDKLKTKKYRETVRGIRGVSLEEEKVGYGGEGIRKNPEKDGFKPGVKERMGD